MAHRPRADAACVRPSSPRAVIALVALVALLYAAAGASPRWTAGGWPSASDGTVDVDAEARAASFRFDASVPADDQAWILAAVAAARPEARRLIAEVDGRVTFRAGEPSQAAMATGADVMGEARSGPEGSTVWLNVWRLNSDRGIDRATVVLHELGHVIDHDLVDDALASRLDQGIPRGGACAPAGLPAGGCAPREERFADTFAKWALGGAVSAVGSGYAIATPASLEDWGAPLGALAVRLPAS